MNGTTSIVIAIGNSDDKLTQLEWSELWHEFNRSIAEYAAAYSVTLHGRWTSLPHLQWQNAAWPLGWPDDTYPRSRELKNDLREILHKYRQDSMAWTTGNTELVSGRDPAAVRAIEPGNWGCGPLAWDELADGEPDPILISRVSCMKHGLVADSRPFLASLGDSEERRRSQALYHLDLAHQEQCR